MPGGRWSLHRGSLGGDGEIGEIAEIAEIRISRADKWLFLSTIIRLITTRLIAGLGSRRRASVRCSGAATGSLAACSGKKSSEADDFRLLGVR